MENQFAADATEVNLPRTQCVAQEIDGERLVDDDSDLSPARGIVRNPFVTGFAQDRFRRPNRVGTVASGVARNPQSVLHDSLLMNWLVVNCVKKDSRGPAGRSVGPPAYASVHAGASCAIPFGSDSF